MTLQRFIFLVVFLITVVGASAQQSREELQKKEQELKKELSDLNRQLSETQKNKKLSLNELALIKRKVAKREELVRGINNQINELDNTIYLNEMDIYRLRKELDTLKLKYAKSIVFAYKSRGSYEYLNFLFSARNFNDAIKRMAYLKSYRQNRETQAVAISQSRAMLTQKVDVLNSNKKERLVTLSAQSEQLKVLQEDKKAQDKVVAQLKGQESVIAKQIKDKEKQRVRMQQAVMAIIKREIEEAARKDRIAKQKAMFFMEPDDNGTRLALSFVVRDADGTPIPSNLVLEKSVSFIYLLFNQSNRTMYSSGKCSWNQSRPRRAVL
jgi:peptidoglycan hydrolase CwlO-like protein